MSFHPPPTQYHIANENISLFSITYSSSILWEMKACSVECIQEDLPTDFQLVIYAFSLEYSFLPLTYLVKKFNWTFSSSNELNVTLVTSKMQLDYPSGWTYSICTYTHTHMQTSKSPQILKNVFENSLSGILAKSHLLLVNS